MDGAVCLVAATDIDPGLSGTKDFSPLPPVSGSLIPPVAVDMSSPAVRFPAWQTGWSRAPTCDGDDVGRTVAVNGV